MELYTACVKDWLLPAANHLKMSHTESHQLNGTLSIFKRN